MSQFGRALDTMGIAIICASSPQAKGRVERANRTLQDRLVKEMRLAGIDNYDAAHLFLPSYIAVHNARFAVPPYSPDDAHRPMDTCDRPQDVMVWRQQRRLTSTLALHYNKVMFILEPSDAARKLIGTRVEVVDYPDGRVEIQHGDQIFPYRIFDKLRPVDHPEVADSKRLDAAFDLARLIQAHNPHQRKRNTSAPIRHSQSEHMFPEFELTPRGKPIEAGTGPKPRGRPPRSPRPAFWDKK